LEYHNSPLVFWLGLHAYGEIGYFRNFRTLETLTLDRNTWRTVVYLSSTSANVQNFVQIGKLFCGRTYGRTSGRTLRPALLSRPRKSRLNKLRHYKRYARVTKLNYLTLHFNFLKWPQQKNSRRSLWEENTSYKTKSEYDCRKRERDILLYFIRYCSARRWLGVINDKPLYWKSRRLSCHTWLLGLSLFVVSFIKLVTAITGPCITVLCRRERNHTGQTLTRQNRPTRMRVVKKQQWGQCYAS